MASLRFQCLLFILHERKLNVGISAALLDRSKVKGFALIPQAAADAATQLGALLAHNGLPVLSNDQDHSFWQFAERNTNAEVIEILLDESTPPDDGRSHGHRSVTQNCFVNVDNVDIVVSLLGVRFGRKRKGDRGRVCCAVDEGNEKVLERLLRCGADISFRHPKGGTILQLAVKRGHDKFARTLLKYNANADDKRSDGSSALHMAALGGSTVIVENLLEYKADPNVGTSSGLFIGSTPLHFAVRRGHSAITELLLAHGALVDAEDFENRTSLTLAVEWGYLKAVEVILNGRLDGIEKAEMKALCRAIYTRKIEFSGMVTMRLEHALAVSLKDAHNQNVVHDAVSRNSLAIVEQLSNFGDSSSKLMLDDPLSVEHVSLTAAAGLKGEDVMKAFLEYGTDVATKFDSETAKSERLRNVELLMTHRARHDALNEFHRSLLHIACADGSPEVVGTLLHNGIDPYAGEEIPLFVAARYGHPSVVREFLKFGVPISLRNDAGQTALHISASFNKPEVVEFLADHGANIHIRCKARMTALSVAVEAGFKQVVEALLRFEARLDFNDSKGNNILRLVVEAAKSLEIIKTILDYGFRDMERSKRGALRKLSEFAKIMRKNLRWRDITRRHVAGDVVWKSKVYDMIKFQMSKLEVVAGLLDEKEESEEEAELCVPAATRLRNCSEELLRIKNETAGNSSVSYFDLLMQDTDKVARLLDNTSIAQFLISDALESNFPVYGGAIRSQLQKAKKRKELLENGANVWSSLFRHFPLSHFSALPYGVSEKILVYLSNRDIGRLIAAFSFNKCSR